MLEQLHWKTSLSASCLHVAACRVAGLPAVDARLAALLAGPADALAAEISAVDWPVATVLRELVGLAAKLDNNRDLVDRAAARLNLPATHPAGPLRVAGAVSDLEAALRRASPQFAEELALRAGPLREQWEARGGGMIIELARLTDPAVVPAAAEIVLVAPYAGGAGAHPSVNRVTLEAVLYHPWPELPETVRLAWLIGQLGADLPWLADVLPPERAVAALRVAMIPPALAAAEAVELARCDESMIAAAVAAWRCTERPADPAAVWSWWNAWLERPARWPVAVAALDQMLSG